MIKVLPLYIKAAGFTLLLSAIGIFLSFVVGIAVSLTVYCKVKFFSVVAKIYIEVARNTPLLIQLFFLYFGFSRIGLRMEAYTCAVVGLTFLGGAYMAEAFRSGFESVDVSQKESAQSLGLNFLQVLRFVVFPQGLSVAVPAICANSLFLLKETSVVSAIALADLVYVAKDLIGLHYKTTECLILLVIFYLILLLPISIYMRKLEKKMRFASHGV